MLITSKINKLRRSQIAKNTGESIDPPVFLAKTKSQNYFLFSTISFSPTSLASRELRRTGTLFAFFNNLLLYITRHNFIMIKFHHCTALT